MALVDVGGLQAVNATMSGSGSIDASGTFSEMEDLNVSITGSGNFNGFAIVKKRRRSDSR